MYLNVQIYQEQNCKNDYDCYLRHIYFQSATVYESHYIPSYYVWQNMNLITHITGFSSIPTSGIRYLASDYFLVLYSL
jgi:hypothetical protein